jgi:hypothetical protein
MTGRDGLGDHGPSYRELSDDELVGALRRVAAEADPVPDDVVAAARAALGTRDLDAELAVLIADSASASGTAEPAFEPVRTGADAVPDSRLLTFRGGGIELDVEVSGQGPVVDLVGQLTGGSAGECVLEHAGGRYPLDPDPLGRFLVTGVRRGPARVRCRAAGGALVLTAWVTI